MHIKSIAAGLMALACSSIVCAQAPARPAPHGSTATPVKGGAGGKAPARADGFGTVLPAGLTAQQVVALIAPGRDPALATLVGAKAWPHRPNTYVAIACFVRSKEERASEQKYSKEPGCERIYQPGEVPPYVERPTYLGVLEYQPGGGAPTLVASYGKPYDARTRWDASGLDGPDGDAGLPAGAAGGLLPHSYSRFDFAPYRISPTETAIGLRLGWHEGYAGGAAFYEALALLRIDGGRLVNILSEPVAFHSDLAGERRKDGTRAREIAEGTNVLAVLPASTGGFADLEMRTLKSTWKQVFTWDSKQARYLPARPAQGAKSR